MNFKGCRCPHCKADMSEQTSPQCPRCNRHLDADELYARRTYAGTFVIPAGLRRYGLPMLMIIAGIVMFLTHSRGAGTLLGLGFGYMFLSMVFDPFDD